MPDNKVQITIEALDKTKAAFAALDKAIQDMKMGTQTFATAMTGNFGKVNTGLETLKQNWMAFSAAAVAAWMAVNKAMQYVELGAKAMQAEAAFENITKSLNIDPGPYLASLKEASAGTIDESHLMQKALKAIAQDIDPAKLPALFETAAVAAVKSGADIKDVADSLIDSIANQTPRALRQLGLITKDEFNAFNKAVAAGAENLNLLDLVIAKGKIQRASLGVETYNAAIAVQRFKAEVDELKESLGKGIIYGLEKLYEGMKAVGAGGLLASAGIRGFLSSRASFDARFAKEDTNVTFQGKTVKTGPNKKDYQDMAKQYAEDANRDLDYASKLITGRVSLGGTPLAKTVNSQADLAAAKTQAEKDAKELTDYWKKLGASKSFIETQRTLMQANIQGFKSGLDVVKEYYKLQDAVAEEHYKGGLDAESVYIAEKQRLEKAALTGTLTTLEKEKAETQKRYSAMIGAVLSGESNDEERNKLAAEKKKEVARIDGEIAKTKIDLQIAVKKNDIDAIERQQKLADVTREGQLSLLQEEVKLRTQLNGLQVERGTMTESQATAAEIAGNRAILEFQRKQIENKITIGGLTDAEEAQLMNQLTLLDTNLNSWKVIGAEKNKQAQADEKTLDTERERLTNTYKLREDLATITGDYKTSYEMQSRILEIERARALMKVTKTAGYTQADIDAVNNYYDNMTWQMNEAAKNPWLAGAKKGLQDYANTAQDVFKNVQSAVTNAFKGMEDALVEFAMTGKLSFADLANSIIKDLIRIAVQKSITGPLAGYAQSGLSWLGSLSGGGAAGGGGAVADTGAFMMSDLPAFTPIYHSGGMGNEATSFRIVPSAVWANAPRYHAGIGPGEQAAIFRKDEGVFTAGQMKALGIALNRPQAAPEVRVDIANVVSPDLLDAYLATARGQNAVLNLISSKSGTIRRIMRH